MPEVEYGTATAQTIAEDRFGVHQQARVHPDNGCAYDLIPTNPTGAFKRLGMIFRGAWKNWPGMRYYVMEIDGRHIRVRSYSDGRIKIEVDGEAVYAEQMTVKQVNYVKQAVRAKRYPGDDEQRWAMDLLHAEALLENVRINMAKSRQKINRQRE